jgi:hypothetical protein
LRVEGDGGKRAYIGMGFAERGDAFDFQASSCQQGRHPCLNSGDELISGRITISDETLLIII